MKKLLGIVVLGLLWCNVGFAGFFKFDCKSLMGNQDEYIYVRYTLDTATKTLNMKFRLKESCCRDDGSIIPEHTQNLTFIDVIKVNSKSIKYRIKGDPEKTTYKFNYGGDLIDTIITGENKGTDIIKCSLR